MEQLAEWHGASPRTAFGVCICAANLIGVLVPVVIFEFLFWNFPALRRRDASGATTPRPLPEPVRRGYWPWAIGTQLTVLVTSATAGDILAPRVGLATPSVGRLLLDMFVLSVIADFGLYWGHRLLHASGTLWTHVHSIHHRVAAPTARAVLYIHPLDTIIQQGIPMIVAALIARPTLVSFYAFTLLHLTETTFFHSGLDDSGAVWQLLFLRLWLPLRAGAGHHDGHHRVSNHGGGKTPNNLGETFVCWDAMFGTRAGGKLASRRQ